MKVNYSKGTCFLVTLRTGGFARGVVARLDGKGIVFGYFFAPILLSVEDASLDNLRARDAVLIGKFGDLNLIENEWPIVGRLPNWNAEEWPMPPLVRVDDETQQATIASYDEETFGCLREEAAPPSAVEKYPYDRMMAAGAVEIRLTRMLAAGDGKHS